MDWIKKQLRHKESLAATAGSNHKISTPFHAERLRANSSTLTKSYEDSVADDKTITPPSRSHGLRIQFMSDLHLEKNGYESLTILRQAPYLLLVGDIGLLRQEDKYLSFLRRQCEIFDLVLLVLGNHEFYGNFREAGLEIAARFETELAGKLIVLDRRCVELPDGKTTVLGCTLHSHIPSNYTALTNDFAQIHSWSVSKHNHEHSKDRNWLRETLSNLSKSAEPSQPDQEGKQIIIATHYSPSYTQTTNPKYENNAYRHCFCSDTLDDMISARWQGSEGVFGWVSGHTHWNFCFERCGVWCVSNMLENENEKRGRGFDVKAVI